MNPQTIQWLVIGLTALVAVIKVVVNELDISSAKTAITSGAKEETVKAVNYNRTTRRFQSTKTVIQSAVLIALVVTGFFGAAQEYFVSQSADPMWQDFLFMFSLLLTLFLVSIPFAVYKTFVIEAQFGFNRTKPGTFVADRIRGLILGVVILGPVLILLMWIYQQLPSQIWWIAFLVLMVIQLFQFAYGVSLILPLFNKLKQLPEGELKDKILAMCKEQNYQVKRIFVMDSSKRSSKTNAFFSGIGKTRTIVLFDSLIEKHTTDEVVAVLGHEIGHDRLGHVRNLLILSTVQSFAIFALFGWAAQSADLSMALGASSTNIVIGLIGFSALFSPVNLILSTLDNTYSRKAEHAADIFSAKIGNRKDIEDALNRLGVDNLSNPAPHPLYVFMYYNHPTIKQRIAHLRAVAE